MSTESQLAALEDLVAGEGRDDLLRLEALTKVFCPFEAIGMTRQEIRHSHFLAYILDPQRPHGLHDTLLRAMLRQVADTVPDGRPRRADVELAGLDAAMVRREWRGIDLLVELPPAALISQRGAVFAFELKIDAREHGDQLARYAETLDRTYPENDWDRVYIFLSPDAVEPSEDVWVAMGLRPVADGFEQALDREAPTGRGAQMARDYIAMMRREILSNTEVEELAKRIWSRHRDALETLYEHEPDIWADAWDYILENKTELERALSEAADRQWCLDTSDRRYIRFRSKDWAGLPGYRSETVTWSENGSFILLELFMDYSIHAKFTLGPGPEDERRDLYAALLKQADKKNLSIAQKRRTPGRYHSQLGKRMLLGEGRVEELAGESHEAVLEAVAKELARFADDEVKGITKALKAVSRGR